MVGDVFTVLAGDPVAGRTTADFLSSLIGSLPAVHELAQQAGIELPQVFGKLDERDGRTVMAAVESKPGARAPIVTTRSDHPRE